jgi:plasmid stabilization system protein ParE
MVPDRNPEGGKMETDDDGVVAAARAIRPYLAELVGPTAADSLDRRLADLLNRAPDQPETVTRLRALLEEHKDTTGWFLIEALADAPQYRPPYQQPRYLSRQTGGLALPAGDPAPISAARFSCRGGDYVWYRPEVGAPVPDCPTHHVTLTRT